MTEAPYVLHSAIVNRVHLGWVVQIYNASESLPNLIKPFWNLPLLHDEVLGSSGRNYFQLGGAAPRSA